MTGNNENVVRVSLRVTVERQRKSPVPLARNAPVAHVVEPVFHALSIESRYPFNFAVRFDHLFANFIARNEPLVNQTEDEFGAAAPTRWETVGDLLSSNQQATFTKVVDYWARCVVRGHS